MTAVEASWRIGVDIGGTFTDLVLVANSGRIDVYKVPTVPDDPSRGALDALGEAAAARGLTQSELLRRCSLFVHGSTIATNTLLEHKGAHVGLLATRGFRDSLEIRRGSRANPWDHRTPYPPVLVPRYLRLPVTGRIDRAGNEVELLDEDEVDRAAETFRQEGVESIAVSLFNSFLNPAHERRVGERIARHASFSSACLSSAVAPVMGEYERTSTAVLNAYVAPRTLSYLRALDEKLAKLGLAAPLVLIQSNGGATSVAELGERSVTLLLSGPAAGVGALRYYSKAIGSDDLISIEIGGTSCDVILMSEGKVAFTDLLDIGGYHCATASVDVHTIGAGGGAIARVDGAGMLRVGPQGAGADPGPACYGRGGVEPTITDAQVVLGRLKPGLYAKGAVRISGDLAERAIANHVAEPLGLSVEEAASGMLRYMDQKLLHAVERVSTERGYNPDRLTLVAAGGAGPLHAVSVGHEIGCRGVYVPRLAGAFCALGMLNANMRHDYLRVVTGRLDEVSGERIESVFRELEREATEALAREGFAPERRSLQRALDLRYIGQQWDVTVEIGSGLDRARARSAFEREHDRLYGHIQPQGIIEIMRLRVAGIGHIPPLEPSAPPRAEAPARPREARRVWIDAASAWRETPIYNGADLAPGHSIVGPAVVDEETTTILIGVGDELLVDASGNYRIELPR
ncbi:MAG: hydantoinase/oxoprolinase family protein [Hyphomicrobiales bacterium]